MHGIWTYHLILALQGDAEGALDRNRFITGESLKSFTTVEVPAYIRTNTKIQATQRPYAILSSKGPFSIRQVPSSDGSKPAPALVATEACSCRSSCPRRPVGTGLRSCCRQSKATITNGREMCLRSTIWAAMLPYNSK